MQTANTPAQARETGSGRPAPATPNWHDQKPRRGTALLHKTASAIHVIVDPGRFQLLYRGGGTFYRQRRRTTVPAIEDHIQSAAGVRRPQLTHHKNHPTEALAQVFLCVELPPYFHLGVPPASYHFFGRPPSGLGRRDSPTRTPADSRPSRKGRNHLTRSTLHSRRPALLVLNPHRRRALLLEAASGT